MDLQMENMFDMAPDLLLRLAEELSGVSNFGVCLDYSHATIFGKGTYSANEFVMTLAPFVMPCGKPVAAHLMLLMK